MMLMRCNSQVKNYFQSKIQLPGIKKKNKTLQPNQGDQGTIVCVLISIFTELPQSISHTIGSLLAAPLIQLQIAEPLFLSLISSWCHQWGAFSIHCPMLRMECEGKVKVKRCQLLCYLLVFSTLCQAEITPAMNSWRWSIVYRSIVYRCSKNIQKVYGTNLAICFTSFFYRNQYVCSI